MNSFEVKRGHGKTLENGGLKSLMEEEFGDINEDGNKFSASFKALKAINVEFVSITEIHVATELDPEASLDDATESHQAYNRFMESATSFNAKESAFITTGKMINQNMLSLSNFIYRVFNQIKIINSN